MMTPPKTPRLQRVNKGTLWLPVTSIRKPETKNYI